MKCPGCDNKDCSTCPKHLKQIDDFKNMRTNFWQGYYLDDIITEAQEKGLMETAKVSVHKANQLWYELEILSKTQPLNNDLFTGWLRFNYFN